MVFVTNCHGKFDGKPLSFNIVKLAKNLLHEFQTLVNCWFGRFRMTEDNWRKSLLTTGANVINFAPSKLESECRVRKREFGEQVLCPLNGQRQRTF